MTKVASICFIGVRCPSTSATASPSNRTTDSSQLCQCSAIFDPELGRALYLPWIALGYVAYYFALSFWLGGLHRKSA